MVKKLLAGCGALLALAFIVWMWLLGIAVNGQGINPTPGIFSRIYFKDTGVNGPEERWGSASPNGAITAPRGSTYRMTSDGTFWINTNGGTTWQQAGSSADIQTLLDGISTTQGTMLYRNASDWVGLGPGTSGQFLKTLGAGANPAWDTVSAGSASGGLIGIQYITTTGAYTYTPTAGTTFVVVELQGGGAGGSGVASAGGSQVNLGGGGGAGGYCRLLLTSNFSGATGVVGAKGTGGTSGNNNGNAGSATTFINTAGSPTTYTASGGNGGTPKTSFAPPISHFSNSGGGTTNCNSSIGIGITGGTGMGGEAANQFTGFAAGGGPSQLGRGAAAANVSSGSSSAGVAAAGFGAGGSGAVSSNSGGAQAGGNGSDGIVIIWEYAAGLVTGIPGNCQFRLTTESGVPVSTSDRTSQSTIYFTPYNGSHCSIYNGTTWTDFTLSQLSLALSGLTSGKNYDVFLNYNSGSPALALSAAWTDDTTRADALTTQNGVYVLSGTLTKLYIGTIRTTSTTATEDSKQNRFVWNNYNRVNRRMLAQATGSWSYGTTTFRELNGSTSYRLNVVVGLAEDSFEVAGTILAETGGSNPTYINWLAEDSTTTGATGAAQTYKRLETFEDISLTCSFTAQPSAGFHFYTMLEYASSSVTVIATGGGSAPYHKLSAVIRN